MTKINTRMTLYIISGLVLVLIIGAVVLMNPGAQVESVAELLSLGQRFLSELEYEQALVAFLRVIEIEPRNAQGYYGAARAHLGLGQIDEAIDILRLGVEMTGDVRLRGLLEELIDEETNADSTEIASNATTTANNAQAILAPFTPEQRAFIDRICDAMLAGDYEYALLLVASQELSDIGREHRGQFIYRDVFVFDVPTAILDTTQDGTGTVIRIEPDSIRVFEFIGGTLNGRYESRVFVEPGGAMITEEIAFTLNGYYHGERIVRHWRYQEGLVEYTYTLENGFYVPIRFRYSASDGSVRAAEVAIVTRERARDGVHAVGMGSAGIANPIGPPAFLLRIEDWVENHGRFLSRFE